MLLNIRKIITICNDKVCFELLKTFRVTSENLASFRELLPPKSGELRANEIFFGKYSFVLIKINTFALDSID